MENEAVKAIQPKHQSKKNNGFKPFIRDLAQEQTIAQWRKSQVLVHVITTTGDHYDALVIENGVFSVHLRILESNGSLPPVSDKDEFIDLLLFKTAIVSISTVAAVRQIEAERGVEREELVA